MHFFLLHICQHCSDHRKIGNHCQMCCFSAYPVSETNRLKYP
uniref:Uncharacterized protein n=1 Tax=Siphoviridae sp. ctMM521 TaxID=2826259 RepID=A0A8S5MJT8_9CAUD|nr:MAG TPA: hypothetical protein [Siphoviridae sp. ctMM521]